MKLSNIIFQSGVFAAAWLSASAASALTLTFDEPSIHHGTIINDQYADQGVKIRASNISNGPDLAVAYDTAERPSHWANNRDPDLTRPWEGGNISDLNRDAGNVLIVQENFWCDIDECLYPDDEGSRSTASLFLDFDSIITSFSFDLIDVEQPEILGGKVVYRDSNQNILGETMFASLTEAVWGDNSYNEIGIISLAALGAVQTLEFGFGGSGAIDNVSFSSVNAVPLPSSTILFLMGLIGFGYLRKKSSAK